MIFFSTPFQGTPIIYVSIAYRLGAFGFPGGIEAANKGALNLGLKDQIAGLQWIQANIESFGGDKSKVSNLVSSNLLMSCNWDFRR